MNRIAEIVNNTIHIDNINKWLDIGTGNGKVVSDLKFNNSKIKIACEKYFQSDHVLNNTWTLENDINTVIDKYSNFDLITLFDVIEHFDKEEGIKLLELLLQKTKHIIIFTPEGFLQQDKTTHPNIKDEGMIHRSGWFNNDFNKYNLNIKCLQNYHYPQGLNRWFNALLIWK